MTEGFWRKPEFEESGFCPICGWEKDHPDRADIECFHCCGAVEARPTPPPKKGGKKPPSTGGKGRKSTSDAARIARAKVEEVRGIQQLRYPNDQPTPRWRR